jgi:hypothetical protein
MSKISELDIEQRMEVLRAVVKTVIEKLEYEKRMAADQPRPSLREAAQAVIDRWFNPNWASATSTQYIGDLIAALREALREDALNEMQALTESEYQENTLVRLSETHQQLGEQLGEVGPKIGEQLGEEYELIGTIDGTYAGRWMLAAFAENASAVWPDGTAVYVRRKKK